MLPRTIEYASGSRGSTLGLSTARELAPNAEYIVATNSQSLLWKLEAGWSPSQVIGAYQEGNLCLLPWPFWDRHKREG